MAENNLDKALAYLGTSLNALIETAQTPIDHPTILKIIPKRGISGDYINGGKITNFTSSGITDQATVEQIQISDNGIKIKALSVDAIQGNITVEDTVTAKTIKVDVLEVKELRTSAQTERSGSATFKETEATPLTGQGLLWTGRGSAKQLVFAANPDKFYSTENLALAKDKSLIIDNNVVITANELGSSVTKSNLRELGRLKGLIVDGNVVIDQYIHYNSTTSRLGLGTEQPNAGLSVAEDGVEVLLGTRNQTRGMVGTYASTPFDIVTDSTPRISITGTGNILLGNTTDEPIQVSVHGKLAVKVTNPDPDVDLHVNGPVRFHGHLHIYAETYPTIGSYKTGDIVWNTNPTIGGAVGWVCLKAGSPGAWGQFGAISQLG
jgi:hypothetical protein